MEPRSGRWNWMRLGQARQTASRSPAWQNSSRFVTTLVASSIFANSWESGRVLSTTRTTSTHGTT